MAHHEPLREPYWFKCYDKKFDFKAFMAFRLSVTRTSQELAFTGLPGVTHEWGFWVAVSRF